MISPTLLPEDGSNTQPIQGAVRAGRSRKADKEKTVPGDVAAPKRRPGRPWKQPPPPLSDDSAATANTTKAGRVVKQSEKASKETIFQVEQLDADRLAIARNELKDARAEFSLDPVLGQLVGGGSSDI